MTDQEKLRAILKVVREQSDDEGLWFMGKVSFDDHGNMVGGPITISEAYLQQQLRRLHAVIETGRDPGPSSEN